MIEVYALCSVETMYTFHIGISKLINKCFCDRLRSSENYTDCIERKSTYLNEAIYRRVDVNIETIESIYQPNL